MEESGRDEGQTGVMPEEGCCTRWLEFPRADSQTSPTAKLGPPHPERGGDGLGVGLALVIAAVVAGFWWLLRYFSGVAVPLAVAVLLAALLSPLNGRLREWKWPPLLSAIGCLLATAVVIGGVFVAIGAQVARELPVLIDQSVVAFGTVVDRLATGPLQIDQAQLDGYLQQLTSWINDSRAQLAALAASAGVGVGHFLAGLAIALIATFFFLASGRQIWTSTVTLVPRHYQTATHRAAERGWSSLVAYMRAQVLVALVDAMGILIGALVLQLPLAWALFALTFITAFVPVVGAVLAGTVACALALVTHGPVSALIMLGITIAVMETEGHFLQPILLGRAVSLHPLAVLIGLAMGATLAGIVGALLVIPVLAFSVAFIRGLDPARFDGSLPADLPE